MPKKYEITETDAPEEKPSVQVGIDKAEFDAMRKQLEDAKNSLAAIEAERNKAESLEAELQKLKEEKIKADKEAVLEQIKRFGVDTRNWNLKELATLEATLEALKQTHQYTSITEATIPDKPKRKLYRDMRTGEWVEQ